MIPLVCTVVTAVLAFAPEASPINVWCFGFCSASFARVVVIKAVHSFYREGGAT